MDFYLRPNKSKIEYYYRKAKVHLCLTDYYRLAPMARISKLKTIGNRLLHD